MRRTLHRTICENRTEPISMPTQSQPGDQNRRPDPFAETLIAHGMPVTIGYALSDAGYTDLEGIESATDGELLSIKGIGQIRLDRIRRVCTLMRKSGDGTLNPFDIGQAPEGLTPSQQDAWEWLRTSRNIFLTGDAGTGKSYLLQLYLRRLKDIGIPAVVTASTGKAAVNLPDGSTVHRAFGIPGTVIDPCEECNLSRKAIQAARVIVIDEVSMLREDVFDRVVNIIRENESASSKKKVVLVGDFFQLPPIVGNGEQRNAYLQLYPYNTMGWCFDSPHWQALKLVNCVLTEIVRQSSADLMRNLDLARRGDPDCIGWFNTFVGAPLDDPDAAVRLYGKNSDVDAANDEALNDLPGSAREYKATETGSIKPADKVAPDLLRLKIGARVMSVANEGDATLDESAASKAASMISKLTDEQRGLLTPRQRGALSAFLSATGGQLSFEEPRPYVNGSTGTVVAMAKNCAVILFDGDVGVRLVTRKKWEIYKPEVVRVTKKDADGNDYETRQLVNDVVGTFEQLPLKLGYAVTIHKSQGASIDNVIIDPTCWDTGQLYVALSRCTRPEGLSLTKRIRIRDLRVSEDVVRFYDGIENPEGMRTVEVPNSLYRSVARYIESGGNGFDVIQGDSDEMSERQAANLQSQADAEKLASAAEMCRQAEAEAAELRARIAELEGKVSELEAAGPSEPEPEPEAPVPSPSSRELETRAAILSSENMRLRRLLDNAGIAYVG